MSPRRLRARGRSRRARRGARRRDRSSRVGDLAQRALRERRERADLLDLVAEELDPQRLAAGRREHIDEPAADGELAALLDPLDALVAGRRELLGERLDARLVAGRDLEVAGRPTSGGSPSASAAADAQTRPPRCEHVERARPLADEVRRRLEARRPVDAAGREQRDLLVAEEPRGRLGGVARVGVLRRAARPGRGRAPRGARRARAAGPARRRARASAARAANSRRRSSARSRSTRL